MTELILVRLTLFLAAFFVLRRLLPVVIEQPQRWHGLIAMAMATLLAFVAAALLLEDSMGQSLAAWALITLAIAVIWFVRWKTMDYERTMRRPREQNEQPVPVEPASDP
jgi:hypothetical protein